MRLARSGARDAGIAGLRVASSIQRAIRKEVYAAEADTQAAEDRVTIEPDTTERVDGPASFLGIPWSSAPSALILRSFE